MRSHIFTAPPGMLSPNHCSADITLFLNYPAYPGGPPGALLQSKISVTETAFFIISLPLGHIHSIQTFSAPMLPSLSRWWMRLLRWQSGKAQVSPEGPTRKEHHSAIGSGQLLEIRPDYVRLCERCTRLERLANVKGPLPCSKTESYCFKLAKIDDTSIDISCVLCSQLGQFHPHLVSVPPTLPVGQISSFELWGNTDFKYGTYFSIRYSTTGPQEIFLIKLATLRGFVDTGIARPPLNGLFKNGSDWIGTGRLCDPASIDTSALKDWQIQCKSIHKSFCGTIRQDGMRPDRLIDCRRRTLCDSDAPYVCLS